MLKRKLFFHSLISMALCGLFGSNSFAQNWTKIAQFPAADGFISDTYFFRDNPLVGLIGFEWNITTSTAGMVKRTTDGGNTWKDCTVPALNNTAPIVHDIWFKDDDTGWIVIGGSTNVGDPLLWKTIDGGQTWTTIPDEPDLTKPGAASVRQTPNALSVTEPDGIGIWTSTDDGATWTTHSDKKNGLAFADNFNGIATEFFAGDNTTMFLVTSDGGLNWNNALNGIHHEGFGAYAIPNSHVFVCAPEDTSNNRSPVLRSVDNGQHWNQNPNLLPIQTTGGIAGVGGVIYVQSTGATNNTDLKNPPNGLLRSTDSGQTWTPCGGPNQSDGAGSIFEDTRFAVVGCGEIVYASDGAGGLWKTTVAGDSTFVIPQCVFLNNDTLAPEISIICDTNRHLYTLHNNNFGFAILEDMNLVDSTLQPIFSGAVFFDSLPNIYPNTLFGKDSTLTFGLGWHPGAMMDTAGNDSVTIRVIFDVPYLSQEEPDPTLKPIDTFYYKVQLIGLSTPADFALSAKSITKDTIPVCSSIDSNFLLINKGCDTLTITQALLAKNNWELTSAGGNPVTVPIRLGPGDTLKLQLRATPLSGTILSDSLEASMAYEGHDTTFRVWLQTSAKLTAGHPALTLIPGATLNFDSLATCDSTESPLTLKNTGCDTITITKADLADAHFVLLGIDGNPLTLPLVIPTDSASQILVRFIPKTLTTSTAPVRFHFTRSEYPAFDSSNVVTLTGSGAPSGTLQFPSSIAFGTVPICDAPIVDTTITFRNTSCDKEFVDSLVIPAPFQLLDSTILPQWIQPGASLTLRVQYTPTQKANQSGTATFFYSIDSGSRNGTITFTGVGTSGTSTFETTPALSPRLFTFDTITECDNPDSVTFGVFNSGCDTMTVTGISLDASLAGGIATNADRPLPVSLPAKEQLNITVAIAEPLTPGTYNGNVNIAYTLADGSQHDTTAPVSLTITKSGGPSTLNAINAGPKIDFQSFAQCQTPDTTIIVEYIGCGAAVIGDSLSGNGFIASVAKGVIGDSTFDTVTVSYDGSSTGNLSSQLFIHSNALTNPAPIQLTGVVAPPSAVNFALGLSPTPVEAGQLVTITLTPDMTFNGNDLQTVQGTFEYPQNNFVFYSIAPTGLQLNKTDVGGMEYYSFTMQNPGGIPFNKNQPFVTLSLVAVISDSIGGTISFNSLSFNHDDTNFRNCVLSVSSGPGATATVSPDCGDSLIIAILNNRPLVTAEDPRPNPVTSETGYQTTVNVIAQESGTLEVQLYDALGEEISTDALSVGAGTAGYTFQLGKLPAGSYYYAMRLIGQTATSETRRGTFLLLK